MFKHTFVGIRHNLVAVGVGEGWKRSQATQNKVVNGGIFLKSCIKYYKSY